MFGCNKGADCGPDVLGDRRSMWYGLPCVEPGVNCPGCATAAHYDFKLPRLPRPRSA